jgi:hypothetical protein
VKPEFEQFSDEPGYYKLLIDMKQHNHLTGEQIFQKPLVPNYDQDVLTQIINKHVYGESAYITEKSLLQTAKEQLKSETGAWELKPPQKGEEIKLYHGRKGKFEKWDIKRTGRTDPGLMGKGFYFTPSKEQAKIFAKSPHYGGIGEPTVLEANVKLNNPLIVRDGVLPDGRSLTDIHPSGITKESSAKIKKEIAAKGHDGVIFVDRDNNITQVVAYEPSKISKTIELVKETLRSERGAVELRPPKAEPEMAGSINLERSTEAHVDKIKRIHTENETLINEARGPRTNLEELYVKTAQTLAEDYGSKKVTVPNPKNYSDPEAWAKEVARVRLQHHSSIEEVTRLGKRIVNGQDSTEAIGNYLVSVTEAIEDQIARNVVASQAGKALVAHKKMIEQFPDKRLVYYKKMIDALGGRRPVEEIAIRMAAAAEAGPLEVTKFIQSLSEATYSDKIYELWINGLLSGPATHVVNMTSNSLVYWLKFPEIAAEAALQTPKGLVPGAQRTRLWGEVYHEFMGTMEGLKQGTRKGLFAFMNEVETGALSKLESIDTIKGPAIKGFKGKMARLPTRALSMEDEFFKAINYESKIRGLAYRQAVREGLKGPQKAARIAELIEKPLPAMAEAAEAEMLYRVFQKPYGEIARLFPGFRRKIPGARYIVPFMRTPVNIAKYGLERTPLNFLRMAYKRAKGQSLDWSAEGARAAIGSVIGASVVMYAKQGYITGGGPSEGGIRETQRRVGWQPYSIKIGDKFYSYNRLEPVGMIVGMAADFAEISEVASEVERKHLATRIGAAVAQNLTSKTFVRGLTDMMNAVDDPQRYGERWLKSFTGTVVPTGVAQITRAMDPTVRRSDDVLSNIKARMPWTSKDVLERLDFWGRPIERETQGIAAFSPVYLSTVKKDPVDREMLRLRMNKKTPGSTVAGVRLTPSQHYDYIRLSGQRAYERIKRQVLAPSWRGRPDDNKKRLYNKEISKAREWAKKELMREHRDLGAKFAKAKQRTYIAPTPWLAAP